MTSRAIRIYRDSTDGRLIATRASTSLKQALKDHFKDTLEPQGYHDPVFNGNVMTVVFKQQNSARYVATEAK